MFSEDVAVNQSARVTTLPDIPNKVLIVDDDPLICEALKKTVSKEGYKALTATSADRAFKILSQEQPFLVLLDLKLPEAINGYAVLEHIRNEHPDTTVIMISGQADTRDAVDAMKAGAHDYLEKPIELDRLKLLLRETVKKTTPINYKVKEPSVLKDFIYVSDKMQKLVEIMKRLAIKSNVTILVLGETGTGKNYLCRKIHDLSPRQQASFVQIGCSNIPEHLIESELFGYEKGAFTDAKNSKKGLAEVAHGGTMLLDEIGEMPYQFQSKLLGLLEDKKFRKIGALTDTEADVRILAATNRHLYEMVQEKKFRLDLYYRLEVATIEIPPLRERQDDIPILAKHFMKAFGRKYDTDAKKISPEGLLLLQDYSWPGNVRQLKNLIERLVVLSDCERIDTEVISSNLLMQQQREEQVNSNNIDLNSFSGLSLQDMEARHIRTALKLSNGNQRKAAKLLNITRDTLRYRLKKLDISPE